MATSGSTGSLLNQCARFREFDRETENFFLKDKCTETDPFLISIALQSSATCLPPSLIFSLCEIKTLAKVKLVDGGQIQHYDSLLTPLLF